MKREHVYHCEGPGCEAHIQSTAEAPVSGWLLVVEHAPGLDKDTMDFCSWECVMKRAAQIPPPEIISFGPEEIR